MLAIIKPILAQVEHPLGQDLSGLGTLGTERADWADMRLSRLITNLIGILTIIAFIFFAFQLILAAYKIISAGGDKNKISAGQNQLTQGIIGIVIVVAAVFIAAGVAKLLGIHNIFNIETWIQNLSV